MTDQPKKLGTIGRIDHGKTSLTAALVRVLASGVDVREGPPKARACPDGRRCLGFCESDGWCPGKARSEGAP